MKLKVLFMLSLVGVSRARPSPTVRAATAADLGITEEDSEEIRRVRAMRESSMTSEEIERAKALRREMVRDHIESLLNIRGKDLPSAEEVLGANAADAAARAWKDIEDRSHSREDTSASSSSSSDDTVPFPVTLPSVGSTTSDFHQGIDIATASSFTDSAFLYSDYTEKIRSMFPQCDLPKHLYRHHLEVSDDYAMRLYFDLGTSTPDAGHYTQVLKALLRVHFDPHHGSNGTGSNDTDYDDVGYDSGLEEEEELTYPLRVEVSWIKKFKKGLRNKSLMDARLIQSADPTWLELDAEEAVKLWLRRPKRNLGLFLNVWDAEGRRLDAHKYLTPRNCSHAAYPALPSVLTDHVLSSTTTTTTITPNNTSYDYETINETTTSNPAHHVSSIFNLEMNPMLDINTVDIPVGDTLPRDMQLLGLMTSSTASSSTPTTEPTSSTFYEDSDFMNELDFPVFNAHLNHRRPKSTTTTTTTEIPFEDPEEAFSVHPILYSHHRRPGHHPRRRPTSPSKVSFNPVASKKVVLTHAQLMSALRSMAEGQEETARAERTFLEVLSREQDYQDYEQ